MRVKTTHRIPPKAAKHAMSWKEWEGQQRREEGESRGRAKGTYDSHEGASSVDASSCGYWSPCHC